MAKRKLPKFVFDYIAGGAGNESSLKRNILDLDSITLRPQVPKSAVLFKPSISIFGQKYSFPFGIAPIGLASAVYPKAELVLAECASRHQVPFILSAAANVTIDEVVKTAGKAPWFQLYIPKENQIMDRLIQNAKDHCCQVLVVTVDTTVPGIRLRDVKNKLTMPLKLSLTNLFQMSCKPKWLFNQLLEKKIGFPNFEGLPELEKVNSLSEIMSQQVGGNMDWGTLKAIRDKWQGKLVLKGVLSEQDGIMAQQIGVDAIVISNHGGRQLDKAPSSISVLSDLNKSLFNKDYLFFDSGIRSGGDIVSSLASGAGFVFLGRPFLYALASGGKHSVDCLMDQLVKELTNTAQLLGCETVDDIDSRFLSL